MLQYQIIETDEGLTVAERKPGVSADDVAEQHRGLLIDAGPYKTYEEAYDAILALQREEDEEGP